MERIPCTPTEECKYYPTCFEDTHHIYQRAMADTVLKATFTELEENKRRNCRLYHERDEAENGWPEYPEVPVMIRSIRRAVKAGELHLSKRKIKNMKGAIT